MRSSIALRGALVAFVGMVLFACPGAVSSARAGVDIPCVGDCSGDGRVTVNELVTGVNIALGSAVVSVCETMDSDGNQRVTVNELVQSVNVLLRGCSAPTPTVPVPSPSPTTTDTPSPTVPIETPSPTASVTATGTPSLLTLLKQGGYVIHWRHSAADLCQDCTIAGTAANPVIADWWKSCDTECPATTGECISAGRATARQLNAAGRTEATAIGDFFTDQGIPIGRVLSSEFCRNVGTAELMAFGPPIEQRADITFFVYDEANRCASAMALIAQVPATGTNTAIIGHAGFGGICPILGELAWSEAAIFKPDGQGGSSLIDRVLWNEWAELP